VEEREREWGVESPLYISKVLGQFPEVADDVLISPRLVREAQERDLSGKAVSDRGRFGMDVARYGEDESCIYHNRAGMIRLVEAWRKTDIDRSRAKAQNVLDVAKLERIMTVDVVGLGAGIFDPLNNQGYKVRQFSGGAQAMNAGRFVNVNAEAWWGFREAMEAGLVDLDAGDERLAAQLQNRRWKLDASQRRIKVESKDDMRARGVPSPDRADAAIMSWYEGFRTVDDPDRVLRLREGEDASIAGDLLHMKT
jgi:hypothetical protein